MKLTKSIFALVASACISANAATITVTNLPGGQPVPVADGLGTIIAKDSGFAALGTFPAGTAFSDVGAIKAAFQQFGDAVGFVADGLYSNSVTATVGGTSFSGANVFTVIGDAADLASATGLLVVDHGFAFADEPNQTNGNGNVVVARDSNIVFGGTTGALPVGANMFDGIQVAPVIPEPSSALLGLLGLSFMAFRRRK